MGLFDQSNHIGFTQILLFILYVNYFVYSSYQFSAIKPSPNIWTIRPVSNQCKTKTQIIIWLLLTLIWKPLFLT